MHAITKKTPIANPIKTVVTARASRPRCERRWCRCVIGVFSLGRTKAEASHVRTERLRGRRPRNWVGACSLAFGCLFTLCCTRKSCSCADAARRHSLSRVGGLIQHAQWNGEPNHQPTSGTPDIVAR